MVKFSCFPAGISCHKPKKIFEHSNEYMHKKSQDRLVDLPSKASSSFPVSDVTHASSLRDPCGGNPALNSSSSFDVLNMSPVSLYDLKNTNGNPKVEQSSNFVTSDSLCTLCLKKSKSLGSGLNKDDTISNFIDPEDKTDQGFSCVDGHEVGSNRFISASEHNSAESTDLKEHEIMLHDFSGHDNHGRYCTNVEPCNMYADLMQNECVNSRLNMEVHEELAAQLSDACAGGPGSNASEKPLTLQRCYSIGDLKNARGLKSTSVDHKPSICRSRSYNDLDALKSSGKVIIVVEDGYLSKLASSKSLNASFRNASELESSANYPVQESDANCAQSVQSDHSMKVINHVNCHSTYDNLCCEDQFHEVHVCHMPCAPNYDNVMVQEVDRIDEEKHESMNEHVECLKEYPRNWWDGLSSKEFSIKRIEHWVSTIDIQNNGPLEDIEECSGSNVEIKKQSDGIGSLAAVSETASVIPHAVQVANNYISTLPPSSTTAQMANFSLPVIPQLSIFNSLRVVNLSGNAIVRITPGLLPKGLHVLNLSRNSISVIEGLRDLTRLRLLDLSYNRIFRIGHGLGSCSSLKELYLAGNKISEVEGLHRLLKLQILDLSYNKISTAKCLGQLAANYSSLQVLNLEGNPSQKNVGDEQLKKSLSSLLPHLAYLNRQPIKANSSKEAWDRASRSVSMGMRSDHKIPRKFGHGSSKSSSNGLVQAAALPKQSKVHHHGRIPSGKSKVGYHQANIDGRLLLGAQMTSSMRRSRSEGTMNVL